MTESWEKQGESGNELQQLQLLAKDISVRHTLLEETTVKNPPYIRHVTLFNWKHENSENLVSYLHPAS